MENVCCICGKPITTVWESNNPYPVRTDIDTNIAGCCDDCNYKYVIPARVFFRHLTEEQREVYKSEFNKASVATLNELFGQTFEDTIGI